MQYSISKKGLTIHITNTVNDCLEVGGVYGKRLYYSWIDLNKNDITQDNVFDMRNEYTSNLTYIRKCIKPTRILSHGVKIQ